MWSNVSSSDLQRWHRDMTVICRRARSMFFSRQPCVTSQRKYHTLCGFRHRHKLFEEGLASLPSTSATSRYANLRVTPPYYLRTQTSSSAPSFDFGTGIPATCITTSWKLGL
ncbi:unnamed protein product [Linum trigynum]|uniref:Uncharacterized protein n=1 Tax=Linum trigynum TaxID=586398 RepID=A0AAV2GM25_9ROSI